MPHSRAKTWRLGADEVALLANWRRLSPPQRGAVAAQVAGLAAQRELPALMRARKAELAKPARWKLALPPNSAAWRRRDYLRYRATVELIRRFDAFIARHAGKQHKRVLYKRFAKAQAEWAGRFTLSARHRTIELYYRPRVTPGHPSFNGNVDHRGRPRGSQMNPQLFDYYTRLRLEFRLRPQQAYARAAEEGERSGLTWGVGRRSVDRYFDRVYPEARR